MARISSWKIKPGRISESVRYPLSPSTSLMHLRVHSPFDDSLVTELPYDDVEFGPRKARGGLRRRSAGGACVPVSRARRARAGSAVAWFTDERGRRSRST